MNGQQNDPIGLWTEWKRSYESVRSRIVGDVTVASGLGEPEFAVVIRLHEAGGRLRQNELSRSLAWDRTRVSHAISRMERRNLVERIKLTNGVDVLLTLEGERIFAAARPHLDAAIRSHVMDPLGAQDAGLLRELLQRLSPD